MTLTHVTIHAEPGEVFPTRSVPCNGCRACCTHDLIVLHPEHGDDVTQYDTMLIDHPLTGEPCLALKHKPDDSCIYLGDTGCTIHGHAPVICKEFDCRLMYAHYSRADRRRLIADGFLDKAVMDAGRRLQKTLPAKLRKAA